MNFKGRSYQKELLDSENIPFKDLQRNLQELNFINTWLGGHAITIDGIEKLAEGRKKISVCEIGCGGGDNLLAIFKHCKKKGIEVSLIGIDIKEECIAFAKTKTEINAVANWICSDYRKAYFQSKPNIIFSSLFCHHFTNEELVFQLQWMKDNSNTGFFINDLHRHPFAYWSIKTITQLFSSSYLVKNDAPLSVLRGFKKKDWENIFKQSNISSPKIYWKWAFRYLIIYKHERAESM